MKALYFLLLAVICSTFFSFGCSSVIDIAASYLLTSVSVETHELTFQAKEGSDDPVPQFVEVSCTYPTDSSSRTDDCTVNITTNQTWLTVDPATVDGDAHVMVYVDSSELAAGSYEGNVHVQCDYEAPDDEEDIAVHLTVTAKE